MHENAARALQYYEDMPRRTGRPDLRLIEAEAHPRRADRISAAPMAEVRTIRVDRQPRPKRRKEPVAPGLAGRPDRIAMWAVMLGFFLTAVAAASGHA
ncbi:MAG: hypothetical protein QOK04_418 [Solirubrobacteraceae bacterium]|jgi:hypothetical protein|nr:hypothetical protein [Solirubrobacteraceae bacterium]MEA2399123.1 hypothetical protein [Thermoleophilaceae bacterium]